MKKLLPPPQSAKSPIDSGGTTALDATTAASPTTSSSILSRSEATSVMRSLVGEANGELGAGRARSQMRTVQSVLAVTRRLPSGDQPTDHTPGRCGFLQPASRRPCRTRGLGLISRSRYASRYPVPADAGERYVVPPVSLPRPPG
jgi:hypothetical protein